MSIYKKKYIVKIDLKYIAKNDYVFVHKTSWQHIYKPYAFNFDP